MVMTWKNIKEVTSVSLQVEKNPKRVSAVNAISLQFPGWDWCGYLSATLGGLIKTLFSGEMLTNIGEHG